MHYVHSLVMFGRGGSQGKGNAAIISVLVGETQASSNRNLGPNDALPSIEVVLLLVHVHGAAFALGGAPTPSHQLCHHLKDCATPAKVCAVISV